MNVAVTLISKKIIICVVRLSFVLFYVVFVCKCILTPGDNPIAVSKHINIKKVKVTLVQALRLCTGRTAHRRSRGIALLYRH
jgi:hypothetical protein